MKEMSQLYARVFTQILESSIAEDFTVRHVFEDFLKVCEHKTGIVDMTRQALARKLNVPMETLNRCIDVLEAPDPNSRDNEFEGRRIERLDSHRDWGWKILNWLKYEGVRTKADVYMRVTRHREKERAENPPKGFVKPSIEEVKLHFSKSGIPMIEAERFYNYHESKGWKVGNAPMKSWTHAAGTWKINYETNRFNTAETKTRPIGNPTLSEVSNYAQEKWGEQPDCIKWAADFYRWWNYPKRQWKVNGRTIDWKEELTKQVSMWRKP